MEGANVEYRTKVENPRKRVVEDKRMEARGAGKGGQRERERGSGREMTEELKRDANMKREEEKDGGGEKQRGKEKVRIRRDLSDHVAGANGVSNGVDQSLPALKHERVGCLSPSPPRARTRIVITSRLSSSESLSSLDPRGLRPPPPRHPPSSRLTGFSSFVSWLDRSVSTRRLNET